MSLNKKKRTQEVGVIIIVILLFAWWWLAMEGRQNVTKQSETFLTSYGYTDIEVNKRPVGCDFDDGSVMSDGGRVFAAKTREGKSVTGLVCNTKNNRQKLTINWKEK